MRRRALVVAPTLPRYDREGGSRDLDDLVDFLQRAEFDVCYVAVTPEPDPRYSNALSARGVTVHDASDGIPAAVAAGPAPDVVFVAFWHLAERILPAARAAWPGSPVVVSSIDLHFVRNARRIFSAVSRGERTFLLDGFYADELAREVNTYAAADAVLAVSAKEAALVGDLTGDRSLGWWLPVTLGECRSTVPLAARSGVLFVGNFLHRPNVEAVEHLCTDIVPRLDTELLARHPVLVVGNAPDARVTKAVVATPGVRLVGWVPSLTPYLHRARVCVVPLLHGAGVKGKLVRSLAAGTPAVSTSVGVEGLDLLPGQQVLVADDATGFAEAVETVLTDDATWARLADAGHAAVESVHAPDMVFGRLQRIIEHVLARRPKSAVLAEQLATAEPRARYAELARRLRVVVPRAVEGGVTVLVASKGDDELLDLGELPGEHFPQGPGGGYLGWHPTDGVDLVARLEEQRRRGPHYLVLPATSAWWLDHYPELQAHLDARYRVVLEEEDTCTVWSCGMPAPAPGRAVGTPRHDQPVDTSIVVAVPEDERPVVRLAGPVSAGGRVLVAGVYCADRPNHADDLVRVVSASAQRVVTQAWAALGGDPPTPGLAAVTALRAGERRPKFDIVNELLARHDLERFDHVLLVDDDIAVPAGFVDHLLGWQDRLGFALTQPARSWRSSVDHRIVLQQPDVAGRRTQFVEIGPVVSIARAAYPLLLPFNLDSPMGWGYENVWAHRIARAGLAMGIVDAVPVDHVLRPPVANYTWGDADEGRRRLLARNEHLPLEDCMRVLAVHAGEPARV